MNKRIILAISLCLILALTIVGTVSAKPAPKVAVCHYDVLDAKYFLINISGTLTSWAVSTHLTRHIGLDYADYLQNASTTDYICLPEPVAP